MVQIHPSWDAQIKHVKSSFSSFGKLWMALIGKFLHEIVGNQMLYRLQNEAIDLCLFFAL